MSAAPPLPLTVADLVCLADLDPKATETTSDLQSLEQDVLHILIEVRGSNPDDPDRGIGAEEMLSGSAANIAALPGLIDAELLKDPRIDASSSTLTTGPAAGQYTIRVQITVDGAVVGLSYSYTLTTGLQPMPAWPGVV